MENNKQLEKEALFEVYSAGYVDGFNNKEDIKTAFEKWYENTFKMFDLKNN